MSMDRDITLRRRPGKPCVLTGSARTRPLLLAALALFPAASPAQDAGALPKQMRIIVASVGGTGPDFIARLIAPKLGDGSRQSVIVDNRPGTNGIVAAQYTARARADGSVIMMGNAGTHAVNAALYKKLVYDPVADFAPISEIASVPLALVIHPVVPAKSLKELIALARKSPGKLNIAIAGAAGELTGNALKLQAKIDMKNIHYKGGAAAAIAVMAGEVDMVFTTYVVISAHVDAGRLRVLGVSSEQRMPQLSNVPTIAESGLPGFEHEQWYALFAPAKTPAPVVQTLHREVTRIINSADVKERLLATGHRIIAGTPQELSDKVRREIDKTRKIMTESGMPQQ
ncbi:MAG: tripartite tricarboxylate transporter substrate binding protein [Betaproteobacteria bacterium]|nr:tripartite tricarboxylate transporter substrate binding protein [Betaproteobacteria bacterium]